MTDSVFQDRYIKARRRVIENDFMHLNETQRQAVMATEGPLLLLAGAGSGKTTVLINRIANILRYGRGSDSPDMPDDADENSLMLLEQAAENPQHGQIQRAKSKAAMEPCEPWRIIAITFTNKAANELKQRLESMLGPVANDIWAQTFHSACVRILRRDIERLGFQRSFTIYDTSDSLSLIKRITKEMNLDDKSFPPRGTLSKISRAKDDMLDGEGYMSRVRPSGDIRKIRIGEIYLEYEKRLKDANAMDFDDLIFNTVRLLQSNADLLEYYQRRFRYVLIDEYQDTNNVQYLLSSLLAGGYENICVVGDDDQSIYKFRGATIENILSFEKQYKDARVIRLERNYRSTGNILAASNAVIANNKGRKGKKLWTENEDGEKLRLYEARNEFDEGQRIALEIVDTVSKGGSWQDHAVLYRMNALSNQIEDAFRRNGVPYRIIGGTRFFDRAEIKDMLAYLTVILTPSDDLRLLRIINTPARGIGTRSVAIASDIAQNAGLTLYEVIRDADNYPEIQRSSLRMRQFAVMIEELRELSLQYPLDKFYDMVIDKTGYVRALEEKTTDENIARIENVRELKTNIISYIKASGDASLAGFLDEVSLYTDIEQYDKDADCVVMMTMHSSKGLEFPTVYIIGAEQGLFPSSQSIGQPEEMEEERRLCYVAFTRAKKKLNISCARQRMLFGRTTSNDLSCFVKEIPDEYIDITGEGLSSWQGGLGFASGSGSSDTGKAQPSRQKSRTRRTSAVTPPPSRTPKVDYKIGDRVNHRAFGKGSIQSMKPMGGDFFIEIDFGDTGIKKMMLRAASQNMEKSDS